MKNKIFFIVSVLLPFGLFAQGESDWWYFGDYAGLHFTNDTVEAVFDNTLLSGFGTTIQSDASGNLLFYCNGALVNNANHELMLNGDLGSNTNGTNALSIKMPSEVDKYFLVNFKAGSSFANMGVSYIDMTADGGLGAVQDHQYLSDTLLLYVTAAKKANGIDYWVVFRKPLGNTYITYSLTNSGLDIDNPIIYTAGDLYMTPVASQTRGSLRINPQGSLIAFTHTGYFEDFQLIDNGKLELFHFDNETGMIGERIVRLDETNAPYITSLDSTFFGFDTEFSTDGEKLYYSMIGKVYQCNISILDSISIQQSVVRFNDLISPYSISGLQLAKDGRLYIASGLGVNTMAVIHHPNIAGLEAGFELEAIDLSPRASELYLPVFDPTLFSSGFTVSNRCLFDETEFELIYDMPYDYVFWDFGDGSSSLEWGPTHSYENTGIYNVSLTTAIGVDTTFKTMEVIIEEAPTVDLGVDSSLFCEGDTLLLDAYFYASYYTWQDSTYQSSYEVSDEGKYFVEVRNICGVASDTVSFVLDRDNVTLGNDTLICLQEPLVLLANQPSATDWFWQDGSTLPFYEAESTGEYFVFVTTPCLFIYDSIAVETIDCALIAPNVFTPNNDGVNDTFNVINIDQLNYSWSLEVYNRWGQRVYYSSLYQNDWTADNISDGVYFYILRSSTAIDSYKGSVTILRRK